MKKFIAFLTITLLSFAFLPNELKASNGFSETNLPTDSTALKTNLISRLSEIKTMTKSGLSMDELKKLQKEARETKKQHRGLIGSILLIGVGAFIAFVLIIIFLH